MRLTEGNADTLADTTMPIDNVKTRMQSAGASSMYRNSLDCLVKIVREEGVQRLWGGTTPRLARLMVRPVMVAY